MLKKCLPVSFTTLAFMITLLFACFDTADAVPDSSQVSEPTPVDTPSQKPQSAPVTVPEDSVLRLIPKGALGVIYCSSPLELNNKINALVAELAPTMEIPDVSVTNLVEIFGAEFESLADFEKIGLDVNRDFAVFITSLQPLHLLVLGHLTDPKVIKQTIEAKGSVPTDYKDVTYWNTTEGNQSFAILKDTLVFSTPHGVCEGVIDTHNGAEQTIAENANYSTFLTDVLEGNDQVGVCFDIEAIVATFDGLLEEEWESLVDTLNAGDSVSKTIASILDDIPEEQTGSIAQLRSINVLLAVEGTSVQIKPSVKFRSDSEFLKVLEGKPGELMFLDELPNRTAMNGAVQGCPQLLSELSRFWLNIVPSTTPEQKAQQDSLLKQVKDFHESLADRWSVSFGFKDTVLPTYLFIYELKDEQAAKVYMDEVFMEYLKSQNVHAGKSMMHNRVEIKSYIFPDLKGTLPEELPEEISGLLPTKWHWYYAFTEGQLLFATGTGPEAIQMALDRRAGNEKKFSEHPSYRELVEKLGTDNNIFVAMSPAISAKNSLPMLGRMDPDNAAAMQLLAGIFMSLPENYSIGFSAKRRNSSIEAKLFVDLGDFKQLIQMMEMMTQMGQR
ncbi:hypothetical protein C6500_08665 [Candidatus Poribacteria bacterium]|nr:MAG: hypothetical protein C6500_08665 [Candidatus Poribacteria bacterium]